MSGITPPSILTMQYEVDTYFKKYVNLSFPFRIKIESIWFTADDALSGRGDNNDGGYNPKTLNRVLRLGGVKTRNALRGGSGDYPTDYNITWNEWGNGLWDESKPSIWFGNPDDRDNVDDGDPETPEQVVQYDNWWDTRSVYRSTARPLPSLEVMGEWNNYGWDNAEYQANKYKTDLSIMNPDEVLSLFCYPDGGDWGDYTNNSGLASIFVQYAGIGGSNISNPTRIWNTRNN